MLRTLLLVGIAVLLSGCAGHFHRNNGTYHHPRVVVNPVLTYPQVIIIHRHEHYHRPHPQVFHH